MNISQILEKMIAFSRGNLHDIDHFIRVWTYARIIGELEGLDPETRFLLETAAITHDIACPLCREKYGNTNGKYQEDEGGPMARAFLADTGLSPERLTGFLTLWPTTTPTRVLWGWTIRSCWKRITSQMHRKTDIPVKIWKTS